MTPLEAYKFCPKCAGDLHHQEGNLLKCQKCGHHLYINAAPAVGIIIEDEHGKILLAKRAIDPHKGTWDIPGGFMEPGETAITNSIREAKEELNVTIAPGMITGTYHVSYNFKSLDMPVLVIAICAKITDGSIDALDDVAEVRFFSKDELSKIEMMNDSIMQLCLDYFKIREKFSLGELTTL